MWGRSGFDLVSDAKLQAEDDGRPPKNSIKQSNANNVIDMAPSVAEADEILARLGFQEAALVA